MDKVTRVLLLYSKLIRGEPVNITVFCLEMDSLPRSFHRDIEDIRLFLSESYDHRELVYDRVLSQYRLTEKPVPPLEETELSLILQLFHDTGLLSGGEFCRFAQHLSQTVRNNQALDLLAQSLCESYDNPPHNRSILKMHSDLQKMIAEKWVIRLRYFHENQEETEIEVTPLSIQLEDKHLFLFALDREEKPTSYRVDWIDSFVMIGKQGLDDPLATH